MSDWDDKIIAEFRANGGEVGGQFAGAPMLLLHSIGAKSGLERVNPMMYLVGAERTRMYDKQAALYSGFATYQESTDRVIPVIALTPR